MSEHAKDYKLQEKVDKLEISLATLEQTITNLAATMSDKLGQLTTSMTKLSDSMASFAITESKVERLAQDVNNMGRIQREDITDIYSRINDIDTNIMKLADEHHTNCAKNIEDLDKKTDARGNDRLKFGLQLVFGSIGFISMLLIYTLSNMNTTLDTIAKNVQANKISLVALEQNHKGEHNHNRGAK